MSSPFLNKATIRPKTLVVGSYLPTTAKAGGLYRKRAVSSVIDAAKYDDAHTDDDDHGGDDDDDMSDFSGNNSDGQSGA